MKAKFESFLSRLETTENKPLLETIQKGFKAITESYADLREEMPAAIDQFNTMANAKAMSMGNTVLNFLHNSSQQYNHLYSEDTEPELDQNFTSEFNQYVEPPKPKDELETDLGLTAEELMTFNQ